MAPRPSIISTDMRALVVWICSADGPCLGRSIDRKEAVSMPTTGTAKSCSSCVSGVDNGRRGETSEKSEYMVDTASFDGDDVDARCCRTKNDGEGAATKAVTVVAENWEYRKTNNRLERNALLSIMAVLVRAG